MPSEIHWPAIALRLLLTLAAGGVLGMERSRTGHPAGLRTTLLVTLAASVAMIQMNLLIPTNGKPSDSYAVMDLMRLPLGILTGVGFIGAGAIVKKGDLVLGITTAATMWFATVVGLCMGGGQLVLGSVATLIGFGVLSGFRSAEKRLERDELGELKAVIEEGRVSPQQVRDRLKSAGLRIKSFSISSCKTERRQEFGCEVSWRPDSVEEAVPRLIGELEHLPGLIELEWKATKPGPR